ncbi:D-alanyl-D-alanine carboxypeptidase [Streptacidiphilus monticola]
MAVPAVTVATAAAVLAAGSGSAAAASGPTAADKSIAAKLSSRFPAAHLGTNAGGLVRDVASGRTVWAQGSAKALMPASTEKLATAAAVLKILGPNRTVRTRALLSGHTLYLVGGGDMHLTSTDLDALAKAAATALKARGLTSVGLRVDDSLFPAPALSPGWSSGYYPSTLAPVRALALLGDRVNDTSLHAGQVFARRLSSAGVHASAPTRAKAPAGAVQLASRTSAPLAAAVEYMLKNSDNNVAEGVARLAALATHRAANWQGVTATVRAALAGYHVPTAGTVAYDASGLSRSDRMTAGTLAYLAALSVDPATTRRCGRSTPACRSRARTGRCRRRRAGSPPSPATAPWASWRPRPAR